MTAWRLGGPVHPRMCGVRSSVTKTCRLVPGSSPHVRGTVAGHRPASPIRRFIPACAGYGDWVGIAIAALTVHPRMCGVRAFGLSHLEVPDGSSPHVRGTGLTHLQAKYLERFIPACAGYGNTPSLSTPSEAVHPRMCGVRALFDGVAYNIPGSSPHVRGTANRRG